MFMLIQDMYKWHIHEQMRFAFIISIIYEKNNLIWTRSSGGIIFVCYVNTPIIKFN